MYNYDALWLTQWNVNSMLGLAYPEVYSDFVKSQLQMYKDGGLLPRGPVAGNYSMVMTGSPVTSFITGAWNKGIRDFDVDVAYDAMMDAHSVGGLFEKSAFEYDGWSGLGGIRDYLDRGYVPQELGGGPLNGGAGQTLEYAHQDLALAQLARQLRKRGINVAQFAKATASSGTRGAGDRRAAGAFGRRRAGAPSDGSPWLQLDWRAAAAGGAGSCVTTRARCASATARRWRPRRAPRSCQPARGAGCASRATGSARSRSGTTATPRPTSRSARATGATSSIPRPGSSGPSIATARGSSRSIRLSPEDFVEANAWQATWFTSHDVMGLANLMGGEEVYANKLNFAFESAPRTRTSSPTTATATSATATSRGCRWRTCSTTSATRG